ncbi:MAG: hypothetical protein EXR72_07210 [Myxococcales bacterium]|nr:hypothetical protein [Myxococcales bacterium]
MLAVTSLGVLSSGCGGAAPTSVVLSIRFADEVPETTIETARTLTITVGGAESFTYTLPAGDHLRNHSNSTLRYRPGAGSGSLTFHVAAQDDADAVIATGTATAAIEPGSSVNATVLLQAQGAPADLGPLADANQVDLAVADGAAADLAMDLRGVDLAGTDLAVADLAVPDGANPDLATRDLVATDGAKDLAAPDGALPGDLAAPAADLAGADLANLPDLAIAPDLLNPPDLTILPDLLGKCASDNECPNGKFCPKMGGFCTPKLPGGGNCALEGDHACGAATCSGGTCAYCPAGTVHVPNSGAVMLGSVLADDPLSLPDELPQHATTIAAYCIDRTEATVADYRACVAGGGCTAPVLNNPQNSDANCTYTQNAGAYEKRPVTCLAWSQAKAFCEWSGNGTVHALGARRLPTEAEWEKHARGADKRIFPWGNNSLDCSYANFKPGGVGCVGADPRTKEVSSTSPKGDSAIGSTDAAGNVWEWVADWYADDYYAKTCQNGCTDPKGPANGTDKVLRGGSWFESAPRKLRCAYREVGDPSAKYFDVGIRCASTPF